MRWNRIDKRRLGNDIGDGLEGFKRTAAIDIRALMIPLFCFTAKIATRSSMSGSLAKRTIHHMDNLLRSFQTIYTHNSLKAS
jgi:hypothetical protein